MVLWLSTIFAYFTLSLSTSPGIHGQEKMLVLPNQLLYWVLSTSDPCVVSFQPIWCHPHTQIRTTLFHGVRKSIPNWKPFHNRASIGFYQIAFPIIVLPKDDRTDFAQEERLGLPYWTMILAICVVVDESKCLDIPIWEFSIILEPFHFELGIRRYCISCLSCAPWQSGYDIHDFCCCHLWCWWSLFWKYCIISRIIFHNVASEYNSTFVLLVLCLQFSILQVTDIHQWGKNELLRPSSLLHRSLVSYFWLSSRLTPESFQIFQFLFHFCLCCGHLHGFEA